MGDPLKNFVDENRDAFDSDNPGPEVFTKLQQKIKGNDQGGKIRSLRSFRLIAAVAATVIILSASLYFILQKNNTTTTKGGLRNADNTTMIPDPVYAKQIDQYKQVIDFQQTELRKIETEHPELYRQFTDEIDQLDSAYRVLKTTLPENPNTEILLEAMIHNLQLQTELLNRQLLIIKEIKQKSKT